MKKVILASNKVQARNRDSARTPHHINASNARSENKSQLNNKITNKVAPLAHNTLKLIRMHMNPNKFISESLKETIVPSDNIVSNTQWIRLHANANKHSRESLAEHVAHSDNIISDTLQSSGKSTHQVNA